MCIAICLSLYITSGQLRGNSWEAPGQVQGQRSLCREISLRRDAPLGYPPKYEKSKSTSSTKSRKVRKVKKKHKKSKSTKSRKVRKVPKDSLKGPKWPPGGSKTTPSRVAF